MKFIIEQKNLIQALNIVQKGLSSKNLMEVLKGIHFEAKDNTLTITTNNLELGILTRVGANVIQEGNVLIEGKIISDIIRKLPNEEITITVSNDGNVNITSSRAKFNIKAMINNKFPLLEEYDDSNYKIVDSHVFLDMIKKTNFAASHDEARGVLTGELVEIEDEKLSMVALDGFRLATKVIKTNFDLDKRRLIIPSKTLQEISKIIENAETLGILFKDRSISFKVNQTVINSRLLDGEFINYKQIIPNDFTTKIKVQSREFANSLDRAQLMSNNNLVILNIKDNNMYLSSKNTDIGNFEDSIKIEFEGKDIEIAFNIRYFVEALRNIDDEYLNMNFNTNISPCVIKPESDDDYTYLLLPVRI